MNLRALEKLILVLEKSWKFVSEKGYEPCFQNEKYFKSNGVTPRDVQVCACQTTLCDQANESS